MGEGRDDDALGASKNTSKKHCAPQHLDVHRRGVPVCTWVECVVVWLPSGLSDKKWCTIIQFLRMTSERCALPQALPPLWLLDFLTRAFFALPTLNHSLSQHQPSHGRAGEKRRAGRARAACPVPGQRLVVDAQRSSWGGFEP